MNNKSVIETQRYDIELNHTTNEFRFFNKYSLNPYGINKSVTHQVIYDMFFKIKQLENKIETKDKIIKTYSDNVKLLKAINRLNN